MAGSGALARAKGVLLSLMEEAYRRREQVALICFAGTRVELRLPPRKAAAGRNPEPLAQKSSKAQKAHSCTEVRVPLRPSLRSSVVSASTSGLPVTSSLSP